MPLDQFVNGEKERIWKEHCIGWQLKFSVLPRKCYYSRKKIWFCWAYKGTAMWTGPGDPVFENKWVGKNEYLIQKLKGNI